MTNLTVDGGDRPRDPDGVPVFFNAYGLADREKKIANTIHTRFNIGSINKAFTQVTINQLIRDGNLSATHTLGQFFPDYSTALDLLTHVKAVRAGRSPGADPDMGIAGGAPGTNAIVEARGEWVVIVMIVMTNFDPPTGEQIGIALADARYPQQESPAPGKGSRRSQRRSTWA